MAQTLTAINACNAIIEVDNSGGTPVDISGESNNVSQGFTKETASGHTFTGNYPIRLQCKRDASLELTVYWTTGALEARALIEEWYDISGGLRTVSIYPNGTTTGERVYVGEFLLTELSFAFSAGGADILAMTATLEPSGAVDMNTAA